MAEIQFSGTIVRVEPDGFGVVRFDQPVGAQANTHGIFSSTVSTSSLPYRELRPGVHVTGVAVVEQPTHTIAAVKTLSVASSN